jgi:hypothetical protein
MLFISIVAYWKTWIVFWYSVTNLNNLLIPSFATIFCKVTLLLGYSHHFSRNYWSRQNICFSEGKWIFSLSSRFFFSFHYKRKAFDQNWLWIIPLVSYKKHELITLREYLDSSRIFGSVRLICFRFLFRLYLFCDLLPNVPVCLDCLIGCL